MGRSATPGMLVVTLMLVLAVPAAWAADGRVVHVQGRVTVNGATLTRATPISSGDEIATGPRSSVKILMSDKSVLDIQQRTSFKIENYSYEPERSSSWSSAFNLLKGAMRFVSGAIGKVRSERVQVRAGIATIGIRGSFQVISYDGVKLDIDSAIGTATVNIPGRDPFNVGGGQVGGLNLQTFQSSVQPITAPDPVVQAVLQIAGTPAADKAAALGKSVAGTASKAEQALLMAASVANAEQLGLSRTQIIRAIRIAATENPSSAAGIVFITSALSPTLADDAAQEASDAVQDDATKESIEDARDAGTSDTPPPDLDNGSPAPGGATGGSSLVVPEDSTDLVGTTNTVVVPLENPSQVESRTRP